MSSFADTFFAILLVFGVGLAFVLAGILTYQIGVPLANAISSEPSAQTVVNNYVTNFPSLLDWFFLMFIIAIPLAGFALGNSVFVPASWFWVYAAITIPLMLFGIFLQDAWGVFSSPTVVADAMINMPIINFFLSNFIAYAAFVFVIIGLGTYVKISGNSFFGGGF